MEMVVRWHNRFGHLNFRSLSDMINNNAVNTINIRLISIELRCISCLKLKIVTQQIQSSDQHRENNLLNLVHSGGCGIMNKPSLAGSRYFVTFIDHY